MASSPGRQVSAHFSYGHSQLNLIIRYIQYQEQHHTKKKHPQKTCHPYGVKRNWRRKAINISPLRGEEVWSTTHSFWSELVVSEKETGLQDFKD